MSRHWILGLVTFVLFALPVPARANMVANGDFQTGDLSGWTVEGPSGAVICFQFAATYNGGDGPPTGAISQVIATAPGKTYSLEFDYGVLSFTGSTQSIRVEVLGSAGLIPLRYDATDPSPSHPESFEHYWNSFTALGTSVTLRFSDKNSNSTTSVDGVLDNVRVLAAPNAVDLSWTNCVGTGLEAHNRDFVCTGTMNQSYPLVVQFKSPVTVPRFVAATAYLELHRESTPLEPFWDYSSFGCQMTPPGAKGLNFFDNIQLLPLCSMNKPDPWDGDGTGGTEFIALVSANDPSPGTEQILVGASRATPMTIVADQTYYAYHLSFSNSRRATCAGCAAPATILLRDVVLESDDGSPAIHLRASGLYGACATINGGSSTTCTTPVSVEPDPFADAESMGARPNPFRHRVELGFQLDSGSLLRLEVLDLAGRRVHLSPAIWFPSGRQTVTWNGRRDDGARPEPGVYFVRLLGSGREITRRVIRIE